MMVLEATLEPRRRQRILSNIAQGEPDECWPWKRAINGSGYGVLRLGFNGLRFTVMAHRAAWMIANERPIPPGLEIDHLCRERSCCNPGHLRAVSHSVNVRAAFQVAANESRVVRRGPRTIRKRGGRFMLIGRDYLEDGSVRQVGMTYGTLEEAEEARRRVDGVNA